MIGQTLAHYEVVDLLGKGGMGEVFRARDTKLGRDVALKILPQELSGDPERSARFEREARALASLQHANIASIYGFEQANGIRFLVMELVEGEDLSQRVERAPLSLEETQRVAQQMAAGLEAAHDRGIVHRDIKPGNVMLTPDGDVKILDFGLARAWFGDATDDGDITQSPTITAAMTQAGTILGTASYMSPEQARGRNVDRRADIWAYGVILWELLTQERLFEGETISDTLAAVLRAEPDWEKLPRDEAPLLCRVIERCIVRDPRQRLRDIGEARILLQEGGDQLSHLSMLGAAPAAEATTVVQKSTNWNFVAGAALLFLLAGVAIGWKVLATAPEPDVFHTMIPAPRDTNFDLSGGAPGPVVLSPDESMIAFTATDDEGMTRLYLRHLDQWEAIALSGTETAAYPFWSPDSQYIGFFTPNEEQKLKKIAVAGGPPTTLCVSDNGKGGTWNEDGTIVFAPSHDTGLFQVPAIGGEPEPVTELGEGENSHRHPRYLPDGRRFLYLSRTQAADGEHEIRLGSLDGTDSLTVATSECHAEYTRGHLLTSREGVLVATPFDLATATMMGGATPLVENLMIATSGAAVGVYSVGPSGMLVYQTGVPNTNRVLDWAELGSANTTSVGTTGQLRYPRISPDGRRAVVEVDGESQEGIDLWLVELDTGLRTRFTFDPGDEYGPCWTPDGAHIVYVSRNEDRHRIIEQPVEGVGGASILYETDMLIRTFSVSPDGAQVCFDQNNEDTSNDVMLLSMESGEVEALVATEGLEGGGRFSPDGRWLAYHSTSAARFDVFVVPAAGGPRKWQVTSSGAVYPQWKADGSELLLTDLTGRITAYSVSTVGESFVVGASRQVALSEGPTAEGVSFSVHPDGERILRAGPDPTSQAEISLIHLVTDWQRGLAQ